MIIINEKTNVSSVGLVVETGPGWCLVRADSGKESRAETVSIWRKGDRVTVIDGQIVGRAGVKKTSTVYEV